MSTRRTPTDPNTATLAQRAEHLVRDLPSARRELGAAIERALTEPELAAEFDLALAQTVIAREHGEPSWIALVTRLENLIETPSSEPLFAAAEAARTEQSATLRDLVRQHDSLLEDRGTHGHSLLGIACLAATGNRAIPPHATTPLQLEAVKFLLDAGADPNATADHGWTPLHTAAMAGNTTLAQTLLDAGADPSKQAWHTDGATPLAYATFYSHTTTAHAIARDAPSPDNLRTAAALGDLERLRSQFDSTGRLEDGAGSGRGFYRPLFLFPEVTLSDGAQQVLDEALSYAARHGQVEAMSELVARGANVNSNPYRGTPLLWATYADRQDAVTWLLDHDADPSRRHDFGGAQHGRNATALHLAAQLGNAACVRILVDRGADTAVRDALFGGTPIEWAEYAGQAAIVTILRGRR